MNKLIKIVACLLVPMALVCLLGSGCQTTKGLGKDVEKLGDKMQGH